MKKFLDNNKRILTLILIPYILAMLILVWPSGYSIITPGGLTNINQNIVIEDGFQNSDNFYSIHVTSYTKMTLFQYLITNKNKEYDVYETTPYAKDISTFDNQKMGQVSKRASYQYSIIYAYNAANKEDENIKIDYSFKGLRIYYRPSKFKDIEVNDLVVKVEYQDKQIIADENMDTIKIKEMLDLARKNEAIITINRAGKLIEKKINLVKGDYFLSYYPDYEISATPAFNQAGLSSLIGGPSGGLLQAMSLYSTLTKKNFSDYIISGTGTLDFDGTIGKIGGARQKVYTAIDNNVDYFFITSLNYIGDDINDYVYKMEELSRFAGFYVIETFDDAIKYLEEISL
ncbi:hypothetical protein LJC17_00820 [Acholeplasma sp. OttesenSCG-928-E16]|nr:hypothetical protein [Acholeplasma sp. OttesenSCG-928-E16]